MSLIDPIYFAFLAMSVFFLYLPLFEKYRIETVVILSMFFYATFSYFYLAILSWNVFLAYFGAILIGKVESNNKKAIILCILVGFVFTPLFAFKYAIGFLDYLTYSFNGFALTFPIGLSFYTFLSVGYLIDVYLGLQMPVRNLTRFSAFITFFPQLTSGPIERSNHLIPQLDNIGKYNYTNIVDGLRAILVGLFMKLVISDSIRPIVDQVYSDPNIYEKWDLVTATTLFSFQVYSDFAGYSLIAIGSAKLLGINLLKNFSQPFLSQSIPEFWRSWHISLSSWIRDYLFSPLQIQLRSLGVYGFCVAALISFLAVGLWHGAGLQFAVFGFIHGLLVIGSTLTIKTRNNFWQRVGLPTKALLTIRILLTFTIVTFTLVLFRSASWQESISIYEKIFITSASSLTLDIGKPVLAISILIFSDFMARLGKDWTSFPGPLRSIAYNIMALSIIYTYTVTHILNEAEVNQFIYYKF